jgi:hypothetical protein
MDWERHAWHTEGGELGPEEWLEQTAAHARGHARQIARLRRTLAAKRGTRKGRHTEAR